MHADPQITKEIGIQSGISIEEAADRFPEAVEACKVIKAIEGWLNDLLYYS